MLGWGEVIRHLYFHFRQIFYWKFPYRSLDNSNFPWTLKNTFFFNNTTRSALKDLFFMYFLFWFIGNRFDLACFNIFIRNQFWRGKKIPINFPRFCVHLRSPKQLPNVHWSRNGTSNVIYILAIHSFVAPCGLSRNNGWILRFWWPLLFLSSCGKNTIEKYSPLSLYAQ